jgi:uncharacterized membrane protein YbhN (UPF0104 family)
MLALATLWIFVHGQPAHDRLLLKVIFAFQKAVCVLQLGSFTVILFLSAYFEEYSQQHGFAIADGFAVSALGMLLTIVIRSEYGYMIVLTLVPPMAYLIAVVIWVVTFVRPKPPLYFARLRYLWVLHRLLKLIEKWRQRAKEILRPWWEIMHSGYGPY